MNLFVSFEPLAAASGQLRSTAVYSIRYTEELAVRTCHFSGSKFAKARNFIKNVGYIVPGTNQIYEN